MILRLRAREHTEDVIVTDFREASRSYREWIEKNALGASHLSRGSGEVVNNGDIVARVSYNGKVWDDDGSEIKP